jgi:hypothetical protein
MKIVSRRHGLAIRVYYGVVSGVKKEITIHMPDTCVRQLLQGLGVILLLAASADLAAGTPASDIITKKLDFPSPVQWRAGQIEVSLIGVAWGPANSPEMISKGQQDIHGQRPEFYPDRPYVLALNFRAKVPNVLSASMTYTSSGLGRVKNVDGDIEAPMELTASGFVPYSGLPGVYDIHFNRNSTTEYWDFFPASPDQREFLFEVFSPGSNFGARQGTSELSFKIIRKDDDFVIINDSPGAETSCLTFNRKFEGTVGAHTSVRLQLTRQNTTLSGTEQYVRIGTTLWLQGTADSLGNLVVEERYPKDVVTGILKGSFSQGCRVISGLFSKPDGSRLQPFEFREVGIADQPAQDRPDSEPQ